MLWWRCLWGFGMGRGRPCPGGRRCRHPRAVVQCCALPGAPADPAQPARCSGPQHIIPCCSAAPPPAVGDWLQGPYVYALYEHYGYSPAQIGQLFIAGFGSSMVFGTFIGALADKA